MEFNKYIASSTLLVQLSVCMPALELGEVIGTGLALILTLIFAMPSDLDGTTSFFIMQTHGLFLILVTLGLGVSMAFSADGSEHVSFLPCIVAADICITILTACWYRIERSRCCATNGWWAR